MKRCSEIASVAALLVQFFGSNLDAHSGPFDGKTFRGQIAYSADGNFNDEGAVWDASAGDKDWKTKTISAVDLNSGDEIMVEVGGDRATDVRLDYVQLHLSRSSAALCDPISDRAQID